MRSTDSLEQALTGRRRTCSRRLSLLVAALTLIGALGCSGTRGPSAATTRVANVPLEELGRGRTSSVGHAAARTARAMVGAPYRFGGSTPSGFDCSGLVIYSYAEAGVEGLPHSVSHLEGVARDVALSELEPGDLLFFHLSGKKSSHVGMYVGDRSFVHAPSAGKRVERVSVEHVYWEPRLKWAGRLPD